MVGIRDSRTGRVLVALRENERAAAAYGVSAVRAKLTAFAISGFFAAVAGVVLVVQNGQFTLGLFRPRRTSSCSPPRSSAASAPCSARCSARSSSRAGEWFLTDLWRLSRRRIGVLVVLLLLPGGLGGALFRARDLWLRWVARRQGIVVPSLLADVGRPAAEAEQATRPGPRPSRTPTPTTPPTPPHDAEPRPARLRRGGAA